VYDSGGTVTAGTQRVPEKSFQITDYKDTVKGHAIKFSNGQGATVASTVFGSITLSLPGNPKHRVGELGAELRLVLVPNAFKGAPDPGQISLSADISGGPRQIQVVGGEIDSPTGKTSLGNPVSLPAPASGAAVTWSWQMRALGPFRTRIVKNLAASNTKP